MFSKRSIIFSAVTMASAQYTSSVSVSTTSPEMPTLSSYSQDNYYGGASSSSSTTTTPDQYGSVYVQTSTYTTTTSTTSIPYTNEFSIYLTQTNSMGVVTGMPSVVTSQPAPVTSQPSAATLPAGVTPTTTAAPSTLVTSRLPSSDQQQSGTRTATNLVASHTGAASGLTATGHTMGLVLAGVAFCLW